MIMADLLGRNDDDGASRFSPRLQNGTGSKNTVRSSFFTFSIPGGGCKRNSDV
jgi:hypothetical protein